MYSKVSNLTQITFNLDLYNEIISNRKKYKIFENFSEQDTQWIVYDKEKENGPFTNEQMQQKYENFEVNPKFKIRKTSSQKKILV